MEVHGSAGLGSVGSWDLVLLMILGNGESSRIWLWVQNCGVLGDLCGFVLDFGVLRVFFHVDFGGH